MTTLYIIIASCLVLFFQVYPSQGHVVNKKMASCNQELLLHEQPYFEASGVSRIGIFRYNLILGCNSRNMEQPCRALYMLIKVSRGTEALAYLRIARPADTFLTI